MLPLTSAEIAPLLVCCNRAGRYCIHVNDQWRVCFLWTDQGAMEIEVTDYPRSTP
ncbi:MAG: hypothetical protein OXG19_06040 [Chloroflexi bacterium]|nr:hypothetical protein [Chloroflexota bacterium]